MESKGPDDTLRMRMMIEIRILRMLEGRLSLDATKLTYLSPESVLMSLNPLYTEWTPHTIYWKILISIWGMSGYEI